MNRLGRTGLPFDDWERGYVEEHGIVASAYPLMRTPEDIAGNMARIAARESIARGRGCRTCWKCPHRMYDGRCLVTVEGLRARGELPGCAPVLDAEHRCDHRLRRIS